MYQDNCLIYLYADFTHKLHKSSFTCIYRLWQHNKQLTKLRVLFVPHLYEEHCVLIMLLIFFVTPWSQWCLSLWEGRLFFYRMTSYSTIQCCPSSLLTPGLPPFCCCYDLRQGRDGCGQFAPLASTVCQSLSP